MDFKGVFFGGLQPQLGGELVGGTLGQTGWLNSTPKIFWQVRWGAGGKLQPQENSTSFGEAPWHQSWQNEAWDPCGESSEDR